MVRPTSERVRLRAEQPADREQVFALQRAAFGRRDEAELVERLRAVARPQLSLVAERGDELVGHVFFSPLRLEAESAPPCAGLAPLAVVPAHQGRGVGSALVRRGLADCPALGWRAVFLLGAPDYYGRFGFALAAPRGLRYRGEAFDAAFQMLELAPGALAGCRGAVHYHPVFDEATGG